MLSRLRTLPRFSGLTRHLYNTNQMLTEQTNILNQEASDSKTEPTPTPKNESKVQSKSEKPGDFIRKSNNKWNTKFYKTVNNNVFSNNFTLTSSNQVTYEAILEKFRKSLNSPEDLIKACNELDSLKSEPSILTHFRSEEDLKAQISAKLISILASKMFDNDTFLTIAKFIALYDQKQFGRVENLLASVCSKLNAEQLVEALHLQTIVQKSLRIDTNLLLEKINDLKTFEHMQQAIKILSTDKYAVKAICVKILKMSETLTTANWVDLLNTMSIVKIRDFNIIEACAYNIEGKDIDITSIYKILLSCGILRYANNTQFLKFIVKRLGEILDEFKSSPEWFDANKIGLFSIITSIGMLHLRDKGLLNKLCSMLNTNCEDPRQLISFVITCGSLKCKPKDLRQLNARIKRTDFKYPYDSREKMFLLNYVWSVCVLNLEPGEKENCIEAVLNRKFWEELNEDNDIEFYKKAILTKLLHVNLYTQLFIENYKGYLLTDSLSVSACTEILKTDTTDLSNILISTLSSYRSIDKYFKKNMLTPFGIVIDALIVINAEGVPCDLENYLNESGQLETQNENEKKIAIKLVDIKDIMPGYRDKVTGNIAMQILLLEELDYTVITITRDELVKLNIMERVKLIKKKLVKAAKDDKDD